MTRTWRQTPLYTPEGVTFLHSPVISQLLWIFWNDFEWDKPRGQITKFESVGLTWEFQVVRNECEIKTTRKQETVKTSHTVCFKESLLVLYWDQHFKSAQSRFSVEEKQRTECLNLKMQLKLIPNQKSPFFASSVNLKEQPSLKPHHQLQCSAVYIQRLVNGKKPNPWILVSEAEDHLTTNHFRSMEDFFFGTSVLSYSVFLFSLCQSVHSYRRGAELHAQE